MTFALFILVLFGCLALGMPIAYAMLAGGAALMLHLGMTDPQIMALTLSNGMNSYALLAIPFFLIAGEVMNRGGLARRIVDLAITLVGHHKGGLGYVAVVVGVLLAAMSGSAVADAATLAAFLVPLMLRNGYPAGQSAGLVASAGVIGPIIPPSIALIFYGVLTNTSIGKLFIAGIVPGLLMAVALAVTWWLLMRDKNEMMEQKASRADVILALKNSIWALGLPFIIIVGLRFGIVTPTEAGVVAAIYSFFVAMVVYRELKISEVGDLIITAMINSSVVMFIVASAMLISWMMAVSGVNATMLDLFSGLTDNPQLMVACICLTIVVLGAVMDMAPVLLIMTPLILPLITKAGVDPVYFGIVFIMAGVIGLLTPPVGTVLAVVSGVTKVRYEEVARGIAPFLVAKIIVLALLIIFPQIITVPADFLSAR